MGHVTAGSELFPTKNEEILPVWPNSFKNQLWYFGRISEKEAEDILLNPANEIGTFLVRKAEQGNQNYFLSIREGNGSSNDYVSHQRIQKNGREGFVILSAPYQTINELVESQRNDKPILKFPRSDHRPIYAKFSTVESEYSFDQFEADRESVQMERLIGMGCVGEVWKGLWNDKVVAIKKVRKFMDQKDIMSREDFLKEASVMKRLSHKNVLILYAVCTKADPVYIILEYMQNGNLLSFLVKDKKQHKLTQAQLLNFALQVATGMEYLRSQNLIHGDLATRNILLGDDLNCKIADFGLARIIKEGQCYTRSLGFSFRWTAPEAMEFGKLTFQSDVWSFGILVMELFTYGKHPYSGKTNSEILWWIKDGHRMAKPSNCPGDVYDELLRCWDQDPSLRPTFSELRTFFDNFQVQLEDGTSPTVKVETKKVASGRPRNRRRFKTERYSTGGTYRKPTVDGYGGPVSESYNQQNFRGSFIRNSSGRSRGRFPKVVADDRSKRTVDQSSNHYEPIFDNFAGKSYRIIGQL